MNFKRFAQAGSVVVFGTALGLSVAAPASAADATGCSGSAISTSASGDQATTLPNAIAGLVGDGRALDAVAAPGPGGTEADPFTIDLNGEVVWRGETASVISPGTWNVSIGGVPISGSFDNSGHTRAGGGTIDLETSLPGTAKTLLQGKQKVLVNVHVAGSGGDCQASVWIQTNGSIAASPVFWAGTVLSVAGLALFLSMFLGTKAVPTAAVHGFPPGGAPHGGPPPVSGGSGS